MFTLVEVGRTGKSHGYKGGLRLFMEERYEPDLLDATVIFFKSGNQTIPYFIESISGEEAIMLKLEEVNTREEASKLTHQSIYLKEEDIRSSPVSDEVPEIQQFNGYRLTDAEGATLGFIKEVVEYPQQWMALLDRDGKESLIPIVMDYILEVRASERILVVDLPEGLLDL